MGRSFNRIIIFSILFLINSNSIFAYIDPGLGSSIFGSLWPILVAIFSGILAFALKYFWNPIKKVFKGKRR